MRHASFLMKFAMRGAGFCQALLRLRYHFSENIDPAKTVESQTRTASRGSHGIILKAQNAVAIRAEVTRLLVLKFL